ncbi:MAG: relaxase/mobilization nuclease domain-containing protein, partial [Streptosporangiaceae bacterium]
PITSMRQPTLCARLCRDVRGDAGGAGMIGKISVPRGEHVGPLLYYLFGPGRYAEHTDPHIVAGWRHPAALEPPLGPGGKRDFRKLTGLLLQPQAAMAGHGYAQPVWHCAMRAAPEDRMLSDDEWAGIAHEVMHRTGLSPHGQDDEAVRWIAVRHGEDHIHIVAMLARQDGGKPSLSWERYKVRAACVAAEQRYGLRCTAPADHTAARRPSRAENEKAARRGLEEAPRVTLRRQVITAAASASSEQEFFAGLDRAGVLVRKRSSVNNPGQVTGYAVAQPGDTAKDGGPVWYGGGKLAADLSWPKLQQRWTPPRTEPGADRLTAAERNAVWEDATRAAADAAEQIRAMTWTDPAAAADAAWAASDTLHVAAAVLGSRILRQAADAYDRAARPPYGRIPQPSPAGNRLRQTARLLSMFACLTGDQSLSPIVLIVRLAALAEAIAELRDIQQHAVQAAAARAAAQHLYAAAHPAPAPQPRPARRASAAAQLAALSFPQPVPRPSESAQPGSDQGRPPPPRRPSPSQPRGPGR